MQDGRNKLGEEDRAVRVRRARVYAELRTAHLERFRRMAPAIIVYESERYDFDKNEIPEAIELKKRGRWQTFWELLANPFDAVELNEPLMTARWIDLCGQIGAIRIRDIVCRKHTRISSYCIGLTDPAEKIRLRWHIPVWITSTWSQAVLRVIVSQFDRLVFGTDGTYQIVRNYVPSRVLRQNSRVIHALPSPCDCGQSAHDLTDPSTVLFLGAFVERKGIKRLMAAWDTLENGESDMRLLLIGKGALTDDVCRWAGERTNVEVRVDPPRAEIHAALRRTHVVVLPSRRVGTWREQVGLPLVEGLAHGCEVVTTAETGLAAWLQSHGHEVVPALADTSSLAGSIVRAVQKQRTKGEVTDDLPDVDGRLAADEWLMEDGLVSELPVGQW